MTTLRAVRMPDDLEALWEVAVACDAEVLDEVVTTREEIRSQLEGPSTDNELGNRVAVDTDGSIVGFVTVDIDPSAREIFVDAFARPGVGADVLDALLDHGVTFARQHAVGRPGWSATSGCFSVDVAYGNALRGVGFVPIRTFHRMRAELDPMTPVDVPALAEGVEISVVGDDEAAQRVVHEVLEDAFMEHWRHVRRPWDEWIGYCRNHGFDASQWWLATVDGVPAGALLGDDTQAELGSAYVGMLGVRKAQRGHGLGRALLLTAFAEAQRRGRTAIRLGVDTENGTGAPALYASVGMTLAEALDAFELRL